MNAKLNWKNLMILLAIAWALPAVAADQPGQQLQQIRPGVWALPGKDADKLLEKLHTNHWAFGIGPSKEDSFDLGSTNTWRPTFNSIPIREQFRMVREDIHWGMETGSVAAGLLLQYSPNTNRTEIALFPVLHSNFTNNGEGSNWTFWLLPVEHRYQMTLRDDKGHSVPKTEWGEKHSKPFEINMYKIDGYHAYAGCILGTNPLVTVIPSPLLLRDWFKITTAGTYHLEFEMRAVRKLYMERKIEEYRLPVNLEIEIKNP